MVFVSDLSPSVTHVSGLPLPIYDILLNDGAVEFDLVDEYHARFDMKLDTIIKKDSFRRVAKMTVQKNKEPTYRTDYEKADA